MSTYDPRAATGIPTEPQRWSSFATYAITDTLAGTGLADNLAGTDGQHFAIFADGHNRQLPRLTGGRYNDLLPAMFEMNAGNFLIQLASERDKDRAHKLIGENLRADADGVVQIAYIGVINPMNPRIESPEEVKNALVRAASFIPKEYLGATDDCGFSPFSIDEKPNHGSPDYAREVAFQKNKNRVEGTGKAPGRLRRC
jgi:methionine synthase II (cobalamin-independent)